MEKKTYTLEQEQIARFAKAMGHPARIAILEFLASQTCCFFGDIHDELPDYVESSSAPQRLAPKAAPQWNTYLFKNAKLPNVPYKRAMR